MKNPWKIGDPAPLFTAIDHRKISIDLKCLLKTHEVLLVFYRGQWCPFCNNYLKRLEERFSFFQFSGVEVILVTPEKPEPITETIRKTGVSFPIVWDEDLSLMKKYRVMFEEKGFMKWFHNVFYQADFLHAHGREQVFLPVPATFLITRDGTFKFIHYNPNFMQRPDLNVLDRLIGNSGVS